MIQGTFLKIPETGDRGTTFCPALSDNMTTLDTHDHDGLNSTQIPAKNLTKGEVDLSAASWALDAGGDYKQTVTLPSGYAFDSSLFKFLITSGAHADKEIYPTIVKLTSTTFDVYVLTNTFDLKVVIG